MEFEEVDFYSLVEICDNLDIDDFQSLKLVSKYFQDILKNLCFVKLTKKQKKVVDDLLFKFGVYTEKIVKLPKDRNNISHELDIELISTIKNSGFIFEYSYPQKGYLARIQLTLGVGMGKTLISFFFINEILKSEYMNSDNQRVCIFVPTALVYSWKNEYKKFKEYFDFFDIEFCDDFHKNFVGCEYEKSPVSLEKRREHTIIAKNHVDKSGFKKKLPKVLLLKNSELLNNKNCSMATQYFIRENYSVAIFDESDWYKAPPNNYIKILGGEFCFCICLNATATGGFGNTSHTIQNYKKDNQLKVKVKVKLNVNFWHIVASNPTPFGTYSYSYPTSQEINDFIQGLPDDEKIIIICDGQFNIRLSQNSQEFTTIIKHLDTVGTTIPKFKRKIMKATPKNLEKFSSETTGIVYGTPVSLNKGHNFNLNRVIYLDSSKNNKVTSLVQAYGRLHRPSTKHSHANFDYYKISSKTIIKQDIKADVYFTIEYGKKYDVGDYDFLRRKRFFRTITKTQKFKKLFPDGLASILEKDLEKIIDCIYKIPISNFALKIFFEEYEKS